MDYGKGGNPKPAKDRQRDPGLPARGAPKGNDKADKTAELLARMKAAAAARAKG